MNRRFALLLLSVACNGSARTESERPATRPDPKPQPRNAGVLEPEPQYGGLVGEEQEPIPGLPEPPPPGPCEEAISQVRRLICDAKFERADGSIRDVVIESCTSGATDCARRARSLSDLRSCPRAAAPASPSDCEAIRLHLLSLALVDDACPRGKGQMDRAREAWQVARVADGTRPNDWSKRCEKEKIPPRVLRCVLDSKTSDQSADCGL